MDQQQPATMDQQQPATMDQQQPATMDQQQQVMEGNQDEYHEASMNNPASNVSIEIPNPSEDPQHPSPHSNHYNII